MLNYEILEKLTRTIGVSGEEDDVRSVILSEIGAVCGRDSHFAARQHSGV